MKRYRLAFDGWALGLFLLIMLPNFVWFAVPAPNDVLRRAPEGGALDTAASVFQVLFVGALCILANRERTALRLTPLVGTAIGCALLYLAGWGAYYLGFAGPAVIALLTVPPCLAFLFFALDRKNFVAVVPILLFTVCHVGHALGTASP